MTKYKHYNPTNGTITIFDSKGNGHTLRPKESVYIDRKFEQAGIVCVSDKKPTKKKISKKKMEDDINDS